MDIGQDILQFYTQYLYPSVLLQDNLALGVLNGHNCLEAGYPVFGLGYGQDIRQFDTQYIPLYCYRITWNWVC